MRMIGIALLLSALNLDGSSDPPGRRALGPTASLPVELRRAMLPGDSFEPIPRLAVGDWLAVHTEPGQSFEQFVQSRPNQPDGNRSIGFSVTRRYAALHRFHRRAGLEAEAQWTRRRLDSIVGKDEAARLIQAFDEGGGSWPK